MKDEISVLVVDDNTEFCDLLRQYINKTGTMKAVGVAKDGVEGLKLIEALRPDVVILDIIMPNLDGIGVLEKVNEMKLSPKLLFIVLSAVGQDVFTKKAMDLGAEYYMVKPFDIEVLIQRIRDVYADRNTFTALSKGGGSAKYDSGTVRKSDEHQIEVEVTSLMYEVGIPAHLSGHRYIREAIILAVGDSNVFNSVTKILYPSIADKFNSSPQKVERSIRNAVEAAWAKESSGFRELFSGKLYTYPVEKPTNSQFIAVMAEKVKVMMASKEK